MNQEIRFCAASDNTRLAYRITGQGPPWVKSANWLSHLEYDLTSLIWQPWLEGWSRYHTLCRYYLRGCGLSDWKVSDFSFDRLVDDLEAVVDAAGLEKFDLLGVSQGSSIAIAHAARRRPPCPRTHSRTRARRSRHNPRRVHREHCDEGGEGPGRTRSPGP